MTDELPDLEDATEDERESAAALAAALENRRAPVLPQTELEAAALLRMSAGAAELGTERRAQIRAELLTNLPRREPVKSRLRLPRWLVFALPVASAAAALALLFTAQQEPSMQRHGSTQQADLAGRQAPAELPGAAPAPSTAGELSRRAEGQGLAAAAPAARAKAGSGGALLAGDAARRAVAGLGDDARRSRGELLARLKNAELGQLHAQLDAASASGELDRSQRLLAQAESSIAAGLSGEDARLVRQDLFCRLAETALRLGQPRAALDWTRRGLDLDGPPTPFMAQLMALSGDAWLALGDDSSAAKSYMDALRVHEALLEESLGGR